MDKKLRNVLEGWRRRVGETKDSGEAGQVADWAYGVKIALRTEGRSEEATRFSWLEKEAGEKAVYLEKEAGEKAVYLEKERRYKDVSYDIYEFLPGGINA